MKISSWLRRVFRRSPAVPVRSENPTSRKLEAGESLWESEEQRDAWLAACDAGCLDPPQDVHNPAAWDEYWRNHLSVGPTEQGFSDMMSSEPDLPALLAGRGAQTILCAGNGLSGEALALALHGFSVTALDISTVPGAFWKDLDPEHPIRRFPGFKLRDDGSVSFDVAGPLDPAFGPPMHRSPDYPPRGGGSLSYVAGDLIDPKICPGPYDVVIERRTLQLFPKIDQLLGLHRLVDRLATSGILVTHQHKGNWRPGEDRIHFAEAWLTDHGFVVTDAFQDSGAARLACVVFSTG